MRELKTVIIISMLAVVLISRKVSSSDSSTESFTYIVNPEDEDAVDY